MPDISRVDVEGARRAVQSGRALLVCAYDDEEKCRRVALEGSVSLAQFRERAASLPKEQEVIFYCA